MKTDNLVAASKYVLSIKFEGCHSDTIIITVINICQELQHYVTQEMKFSTTTPYQIRLLWWSLGETQHQSSDV